MRAFTLIELIIYTAILSTILILATGFLWLIVSGNIKETSYQEIQQNERFAMTKITQEVKKATGVNNPTPGNSANSLSLQMANSNLNPTVFDVIDGKLRITQGVNSSYYLTTDRVIVNNLKFINLSYQNTPGTIQVEMTIDYINPGNRMEYQASVSLTSSVSLIPGGAVVTPGLEILRPTAHDDRRGRTTNPTLAYDEANGTTFATTVYRGSGDSIIFHTWQTTTQSYTNLVLKYRYHADVANDDTYAVAYSIDSDSSWVDLVFPTSAGAGDTTISVNFSPFQDLSNLQVKIYTSQTKSPDNKNIYTRDIWAEGTF